MKLAATGAITNSSTSTSKATAWAIFALTGQIAELAGPLFPLSFIAGALVTSLAAYSYIKMSNRWPSSGGIAMILQKAYGPGVVAASASLLMALSMVINESLVARTFATYALRPFELEQNGLLVSVLALGLIVFAYLVNAAGNRSVSGFSLVMSAIKIGGIAVFAIAAIWVSGFASGAFIAPGSAARAQKLLTREADDSVTASIVTCREAYTALSNQWAGMIDDMTLVAGRQLYPKQTEALAKAKLIADLPVAYQYLTGISKDASKGAGDVAAAGGASGLTLATFSGMTDVNNDIGILAGYLVASIPFLAGGVARGAMAISGQATSYLNPSQNAAEEAAREASTGNVSLGNTNLDNSSVFSRQFAQGSLAPNIAYGAAQTRGIGESGTQTTGFPQAEFATVPTSSYPFTPTLGQDFSSRLSTMASESRSQSETFSNLAQQSTSSAVTRFSELRDAYTRSRSNETVSGTSTNDSIGRTFSELDNASNTLQQQFGLSRRASDDISVSWFLNGDAGVGAKAEGDVFSGSGGIKGGRNQSWTDSDSRATTEGRYSS